MALKFSLSDLPLRTKGILLVAIPLLFQLVCSVTLAVFEVEAESAEREERHSREILFEVGIIERKVYQLVMEFISYTTYRRSESLRDLDRIRGEVPDSFKGLERLVKDDEIQKENVRWYKRAVEDFLVSVQGIRDALAEGDNLTAAIQGRKIRDQLSGASFLEKSYKIRFLEQNKLSKEHRELYEHRAVWRQWIFCGIGINTILAVLGSILFAGDLSKRMSRIITNTERLTMGKPLAPVMPGKDEIATLDKVFHRMADELTEAVQRETALVENAADVIFSVDANLQFVTVSPACKKLWGYEPDDLLGKRLMTLVPKEKAEAMSSFLRSVKENTESQAADVQIVCKSGECKDFVWSVLWSASKKSYFCVAHDVTDRKKIERAKQDFLNMVSHDIRTPLSSMQTFLDVLAHGVYGNLNEAGAGKAKMVASAVGRLVGLVNDLLDVEKMESGNLTLKIRSVPVDQIVEGSVELVSGFAEQQNVSIKTGELSDIRVDVDEDRIVQVLQNLMVNAVKFSPEKQVISVGVSVKDKVVRFSVRDRGPGIKQSDLGSLFERFTQLEGGDGKKRRGTGLGLAICREIVHKHGGEIGVDSKIGQGSIFWFEIPRSAAAIAEQAAPAKEAEGRGT